MQTFVWAAARMLMLHMVTAPIWRLRQYRHETKGAPGGVQGRAALRAGAKGKLCPHRLRRDSGSFPPGTQAVKPEIHTVFLGFPTFFPKKNLSPPALADGGQSFPAAQRLPWPHSLLAFLCGTRKEGPRQGSGSTCRCLSTSLRTQCPNLSVKNQRFLPALLPGEPRAWL